LGRFRSFDSQDQKSRSGGPIQAVEVGVEISIKAKKVKVGKKEKKAGEEPEKEKPKKVKSLKEASPKPKKKKVKASSSKTATSAGARSESDPEYDTIRSLKAAIQLAQEQLVDVHKQTQDDAVQYQQRLKTAKMECKEQLEALYRPMITSHMKDGKEQQQRQMETTKMIEYLRAENAKIRSDIDYYAREIKKVMLSNDQLESANKKAADSYKELNDHVDQMTAVNHKLNENVSIFKQHLKTMKADYLKRTRFHMCEVKTSNSYQTCLNKIVSSVQDRSRDATLIDDLATMVEVGATQAVEDKAKHVPPVDLRSLPVPKGLDDMTKQGTWSFMEEDGKEDDSDSDNDDEEDDDDDDLDC
jgi:hypothetical protein